MKFALIEIGPLSVSVCVSVVGVCVCVKRSELQLPILSYITAVSESFPSARG